MTAVPLLMPHPGRHRAEREPHPLALFFRRAVAAVRRRLAVPEIPREVSGAATALLASLWPCCVHCADGSPCDPRDQHREPCYDCDDAPAPGFTPRHASTEPIRAGGRLLGDLPRRQPGAALPYVAPLVDRGPDSPPWYTTVLPVYGERPELEVGHAPELARIWAADRKDKRAAKLKAGAK